MSERCTLEEAFELLAPDFTAMEAAAEFTEAIQDGRLPLYCNGKVVEPHMAAVVKVVPKSEAGPADVVSTGPGLGWAPWAYNWEFDRDAVLALKPQPDTRVESAQATAITAQQKAEAATAEMASMRAELEKALAKERAKVEELQAALQAVTERMKKTEAAEEQVEAATDNPQRRKPGPKPTYPLWRLEAGTFAHQFFKKKKRMPSAGEVAEHLQIKCDGWEPPESDIRELLRFLYSE